MKTGTEWHPFLVPSTKKVEHKLNRETAELLVSTAPNDLVRIIGSLAADNDTDSLKHFMPLVAKIASSGGFKFTPSKLETLKFAVAHMFIADGDLEDFAQEWLDAFKTTLDEVRQYAEAAKKAAFNIEADIIQVQRFIGACKIFGEIFQDKSITGSDERFPEAFFTTPTDHVRAVLAATLYAVHPNELPMSHRDGYNTPLAELMMRRHSFFIPIVAEVYGQENSKVRQQMQEAIKEELRNSTRMNKDELWGAMAAWGDTKLAQAAIESNFSYFDHSSRCTANGPFIEAYTSWAQTDPDAGDICTVLTGLGIDVDQSLPPHGDRFIDAAIKGANVDLFGTLLAKGADLDKPREVWEHQPVAMDLLLSQSFNDIHTQSKIDRMIDIARQWKASKAARAVLEELDIASPTRSSP